MANIIKVRVPETLKDMEAESLPYHVWLPYVQINSERFLCPDTQEVWHRFSDITIFSETGDYPDEDLSEDIETLPPGLVSWHGKNGSMPKAGDVFQVFDTEDSLLFEENISGIVRLYDREYAVAEKNGPFAWESLETLKDAVCTALDGMFKRSYDPDPNLWRVSTHTPVCTETLHASTCGIPFKLTVQEYVAQKDCELLEYKDEAFHYRPFAAGAHWFSVAYFTENDPSHTCLIGWGDGYAKDAASTLNNVFCKEQAKPSLASQIQNATGKASESQSLGDRNKGVEKMRE